MITRKLILVMAVGGITLLGGILTSETKNNEKNVY